ncbi:hypothetical protein L1049_022802 [Liquidambar formosana]|uniref:DYW domain-containing protein n=1 Tax=Liquidambar formosana TaxID=63359 RepID=A0AAP0RD10_LIQFO
MECDFFSLKMHSPSHSLRGLFLPVCPLITPSVQFPKKPHTLLRPLLPFIQLKSSSCAALDIVEPNYPTSDLAFNNTRSLPGRVHDGFWKIPRKLPNPIGPNLLPSRRIIETDAKCRIERGVSLNSKEMLRWYSGMLRMCASKGSLNEGKAVHGQVIINGVEPDSHLWISLVNVYAKCGSLECARRVFDEMPEWNVVSWTALISGFVDEGYGRVGVDLFCKMRKEGFRPNEFTLTTALKACSMCSTLDLGKQVHAEVIKVGAFSDLIVGSALVDLYAKSGEMELARRVFSCMPEKNAVSWNALLNGYAQMGDGKEILKLFCEMTVSEMKICKFTLSTVLKGCANSGNLREGQAVHSLAIRNGCELDEFLSCSLLDMYSKCGMADAALKVFGRIKDPDIVSWSAMISCLGQQGKSQEAELFHLMRHAGVRPNQFTLSSLVSAATDLGDLSYGESIHAFICKFGFESDNSVGNALVRMYMKTGSVRDGCRVFEAMSDRDVVSWNALLSGFHEKETCNQWPRIFSQMLVEGFKSNMYLFDSILRSCSSLSNVGFGKQVHAHIVKNSLAGNDFVGTALIDMYAKSNCLEDAVVVFNRLIERDVFTWTVIITGYAQTDQAEKAVKCFSQMQREGVTPNEFTLASCLNGCSHIATLANGQQLHSMVIKAGQLGDMFVASALVDMYGKCGCIEDAEAIFKSLVSRDTILWNTIICVYAQHGQGEKALEASRSMLDEGTMPDEITFIGVLSACSHMGWIEEGKKHFNLLRNIYGIAPTIQHHTCMVDMLGRAGRFDEVERYIEEMKLIPTASIWETVLGACKLHGNVEFGERAADKLFELVPEMDSSYVLLSNIFALKGRWDDVRKVRTLMSDQSVKKEPGCSWVEVDAQVHVFLSQDSSHPKIRDIYLKLEELGQKLTSAGYIPKMEHVLHDVTDKEKKENLFHHSERLALAFALISTNPRKTIRIYKNLRICGDCHDVMKVLSDITNREIVIRDIKRFHHFKNGTCSCQDYW